MKKTAQLYRMMTDKHICPYGLKSLDLLKRQGYEIQDIQLKSRDKIDSFKADHNVKTTPQTFIEGKRIGGYDDLLTFFGKANPAKSDKKTYRPIVAVFSMTLGMAVAVGFLFKNQIDLLMTFELFISLSMCVLAILKLRDLEAFSLQFITYDLLAMKVVRYSYVYPFMEALAGLGMVSKIGLLIVSPISFIIGSIGAVSVFKAVYIDKRDLKCACVGGNSNVPLGFISLTENIMMMFMGIWMMRYLFF